MTVYGLTGKTGAGKSTVAAFLKEKGFYIIDGDVIARHITDKGKPALKLLSEHFGADIINADGTLNRKLLASRAFSSPENTAVLNSITHPLITEEFEKEIEKAVKEGYTKAVIDAAALLESECKNLCSKIIVVYAPEKMRLKRILSRDGITEREAKTRMKAQKSDEYYFSHADIIVKSYLPHNIEKQLQTIL
ncbi:MAG: dephospho-CoA kinase [Clostridia bacterium]|nr:dephospho-CoA kinase [Clostridia bacterium]